MELGLTDIQFAAHLRVAADMMDCTDNAGNHIVPGIVRSMRKASGIIDAQSAQLSAKDAEIAERDALLVAITAKYETAVKIQCQMTALQHEAEAQLAERDAEIARTGGYVAIPKWQYDAIRADLARVAAERDAAVELLGKLDRCVMLLDASKKSLMPNPAVLHAIHFSVNAMEEWRTPAKQDEEG